MRKFEEEIGKIVKELCSTYRKYEAINVISIAKQMGFCVGCAVVNDDIDGFLLYDKNDKHIMGFSSDRVIGVNADLTLKWKRFVIASELVHFLYEECKTEHFEAYAHKCNLNQQDDYIKKYAIELLFPEQLLELYSDMDLISFDKKVHLVSEILLVPEKIVAIKLEGIKRA